MVEYAGFELALWQLSHGLEWIAGVGLVATLAIPPTAHLWLDVAGVLILGLLLVLAISIVGAATARLAIDTTVRFYWQCTLAFAVLAISTTLLMRLRS